MKKKRVMKIFLANQTWADGTYHLAWGVKTVNSNFKRFKKYKTAIAFKKGLVKKYKKLGYKIDYIYAAD